MPRLQITPDQLAAAGKRLYGDDWKPELAGVLDVSTSTLNRWLAGTVEIPGPVGLAIELLLERGADLRLNRKAATLKDPEA